MAKNIIMKQLTSSGYEEIYPKTIPSQIEGFSESANAGAFAVGDILFSARQDLSDDWILCNGAEYNPDIYPQLVKYRPFDYGNATVQNPNIFTTNHEQYAQRSFDSCVYNNYYVEAYVGYWEYYNTTMGYISIWDATTGTKVVNYNVSLTRGDERCSVCCSDNNLIICLGYKLYYTSSKTITSLDSFSQKALSFTLSKMCLVNNQIWATDNSGYRYLATNISNPSFSSLGTFPTVQYVGTTQMVYLLNATYYNGKYYAAVHGFFNSFRVIFLYSGTSYQSLTEVNTSFRETSSYPNVYTANFFVVNEQLYYSVYFANNSGTTGSNLYRFNTRVTSRSQLLSSTNGAFSLVYSNFDGYYIILNSNSSDTKITKDFSSYINLAMIGPPYGTCKIIQDTATLKLCSGNRVYQILRYPKVPSFSATGGYYYIRGK